MRISELELNRKELQDNLTHKEKLFEKALTEQKQKFEQSLE